MRHGNLVALVLLSAVTACAASPDLPVSPGERQPHFEISDAANGSSNHHFYFLPPLVHQPATAGVFDGSLQPTVEVCQWSGRCTAVVARFTTTAGTGNALVRVDAGGEQYAVNWDTRSCITGACVLDPALAYRLRVTVAGVLIGFADVDVVSNGSELRNVQTGEAIGLVNGRTLPVKFRLERGAIAVVPAGGGGSIISAAEGGTIATANGATTILIPPNALPASSASTTITVAPVAPGAAPPSATLVPGTIYDYGPTGTTFSAPVTLTVAYDATALPAGVAESQLRLFTAVNGSWVLVPGSAVDLPTHTVTGQVSHFSEYAVMGLEPDPSPPTNRVAIVIDPSVFRHGSYYAGGLLDTCTSNCWPRAKILDQNGVDVGSGSITVSLVQVDGIGGVLSGELTRPVLATGGGHSSARFDSLRVSAPGNYRLVFSAAGALPATTFVPFHVYTLEFELQPTASPGETRTPSDVLGVPAGDSTLVRVRLADYAGMTANRASDDEILISLLGPGGTLTGTTRVHVGSGGGGLAAFRDLKVQADALLTGLRLVAHVYDEPPALSTEFNIDGRASP